MSVPGGGFVQGLPFPLKWTASLQKGFYTTRSLLFPHLSSLPFISHSCRSTSQERAMEGRRDMRIREMKEKMGEERSKQTGKGCNHLSVLSSSLIPFPCVLPSLSFTRSLDPRWGHESRKREREREREEKREKRTRIKRWRRKGYHVIWILHSNYLSLSLSFPIFSVYSLIPVLASVVHWPRTEVAGRMKEGGLHIYLTNIGKGKPDKSMDVEKHPGKPEQGKSSQTLVLWGGSPRQEPAIAARNPIPAVARPAEEEELDLSCRKLN